MVAGHSVTVSGHLQDAGSDESDWYVIQKKFISPKKKNGFYFWSSGKKH